MEVKLPDIRYLDTEGVEMTTGLWVNLLFVGFAMRAHLAERFNTDEHKIVDHYTCIVGDGCLMEGQRRSIFTSRTLKIR